MKEGDEKGSRSNVKKTDEDGKEGSYGFGDSVTFSSAVGGGEGDSYGDTQ